MEQVLDIEFSRYGACDGCRGQRVGSELCGQYQAQVVVRGYERLDP